MSRYEVIHNDKGLAFGFDHACGEFLMIWKRPSDSEDRKSQDLYGPDTKDIIVDVDTMFNKDFNHFDMMSLIQEHGFTLTELKDAKNLVDDIVLRNSSDLDDLL